MTLKLRILAPNGYDLHIDLVDRLRHTLTGIEVPFTIEPDPEGPMVEIRETSDAEARFVVRILQRAGYDIELLQDP
jgi:hypothetical protein